jgi:acetyltransferase-like isoleucine patch superfamily enzyme
MIIARLKKDPTYRFRTPYTDRQLVTIFWYRGLQAVRGLPKRLTLRLSGGLLFCGRSVVVEHGYLIRSGANLILEDFVQINALSEKGVSFGRNVTIGKGAIIACTGVIANRGVGLEIGDYSAVGAQSFIGCQGGIRLGSNVIMGPGVRIFSENHNYADLATPIRLQGENRTGVVIEDDCWIGSGVTILDGVTIGNGSLIAAGSVVTKSIPPFSVVAGVPAKVLKNRRQV